MGKDEIPPHTEAQKEMLKKWFPNQTEGIDDAPLRHKELPENLRDTEAVVKEVFRRMDNS